MVDKVDSELSKHEGLRQIGDAADTVEGPGSDKLNKKFVPKLSGYNGADEDEIMEKIIKNYSDTALDSGNNKTE